MEQSQKMERATKSLKAVENELASKKKEVSENVKAEMVYEERRIKGMRLLNSIRVIVNEFPELNEYFDNVLSKQGIKAPWRPVSMAGSEKSETQSQKSAK